MVVPSGSIRPYSWRSGLDQPAPGLFSFRLIRKRAPGLVSSPLGDELRLLGWCRLSGRRGSCCGLDRQRANVFLLRVGRTLFFLFFLEKIAKLSSMKGRNLWLAPLV